MFDATKTPPYRGPVRSDNSHDFANYGLTFQQLVDAGVEPVCDMPEGDGQTYDGEGQPNNADTGNRVFDENEDGKSTLADMVAAGLV